MQPRRSMPFGIVIYEKNAGLGIVFAEHASSSSEICGHLARLGKSIPFMVRSPGALRRKLESKAARSGAC